MSLFSLNAESKIHCECCKMNRNLNQVVKVDKVTQRIPQERETERTQVNRWNRKISDCHSIACHTKIKVPKLSHSILLNGIGFGCCNNNRQTKSATNTRGGKLKTNISNRSDSNPIKRLDIPCERESQRKRKRENECMYSKHALLLNGVVVTIVREHQEHVTL